MRNNRMKKIFIFVSFLFLLIISIFFIYSKVVASSKLEGIESFPDSYKPYLKEISKKHPNWKFVALYTNLDWNYVINEENVFGKNLIPKNYTDNWKNTTPGQYNVEVDKGWVDCSKKALEYCMDPRNFLNEVRIFQFEALSYNSNTNSLYGIEKILYGTEFYDRKVSYFNNSGNVINMNEKYSDLILKGGQVSKVSPYHLASRIKQEVGPFLTHNSISGKVQGYEGLYNFYNIGATSSTEPMGAIKNGLKYARDGNGASETIRNKYLIPWNNKERAITGGAIFIGSSYINVGQNTIYLQKFDVNDDRDNNLFWHQYMTNVLAPFSESKSIYNGYKNSGLLDTSMYFIIPVFENMPKTLPESPDINSKDFENTNTEVYCDASNVNIRTGPSTSYEIITTVSNNYKMTRIAKGIQSGERWDKVMLENGIVGYISQIYVKEIPKIQIERIDLDIDSLIIEKGETKKLNVNIYPKNATNKNLIYSCSNKKVATVDNNGNIKAIRSGNATITVKAEENDVQSQIEITVYSKVTDILLNQTDVYMEIGDNFQIVSEVYPEDANDKTILYESMNPEIATVDNYGIITAIKEGETTIIAISNESQDVYASCKVNVVRKIEANEILFDESLSVNNLEVSGIDYNENTVSDIILKVTTDLEIEIVNNKDELLQLTDIIGTGSKIRLKENSKILKEYKIIIYGDANGDGKINSIDLLIIQRDILEIERLEEIFRKASNIKKDGKKPSSVDLLFIQRHILGFQIIEQ